MKKKLLSIIIPAYNAENYLRRCLDSIIRQIDDFVFVVIIDDASTDKTGEICDEYHNKYPKDIIVYHNDVNCGLSHSRNIGIASTDSEYIMFVDADDYLEDNVFTVLKDNIIASSADIFEYGFNVFRNGKYERTQRPFRDMEENVRKTKRGVFGQSVGVEDYLINSLSSYVYEWYAWKYIFKRKLFCDERYRFPVGMHYEDVYTILTILLCANAIKPIDCVVYNYMLGNPGSITNGIKTQTEIDKIYATEHSIHVSERVKNEQLKMLLKSNFSKLYYSALIILYGIRDPDERQNFYKLLKSKRYLASYAEGKEYKFLNCILNIFGVKFTSGLLYFRMVIKRGK